MVKEFSRTRRVGQLLKEEISRLIRREVKDTRVEMVTVTDVDVTRDLKYADVYVQIRGDEETKAQVLEGLDSAAGFIRTRLGRELHIRRVPEIRFEIDRSQERAARINQLLEEVRSGEDADAEDEEAGD